VARAYLDQLTRSNAIPPERASTLTAALARVEELRTGQEKDAAEVLAGLDTLVTQLQKDAAAAQGRDAARLRALVETVKGRTARLRG
jgi:hypothetical protein